MKTQDHKVNGKFRRGNSAASRAPGGFDLNVKVGLTRRLWAEARAISAARPGLSPHDAIREALHERYFALARGPEGASIVAKAEEYEAEPLRRAPPR